jgi:hypothetical protein
MNYSEIHWIFLSFFVRRIIAISFVAGGLVLAIYGALNILPG